MRPIIMVISLFLLGLPAAAAAQDADSLLQALDSPDWTERHEALYRLLRLDASERPPAFAGKVIELLDREAAAPDADGVGDGYGEYQILVVEAVEALDDSPALNDPRVLRGMAVLGIQTGRSAEEFLAARGSAALPYLEAAWDDPYASRSAIVGTWALLLGPYRDRITRDERHALMRRYLDAGVEEAIAFAHSAGEFGLVELIPVLEELATSSRFEPDAEAALEELVPRRAAIAPAALAQGVADWLAAICRNAAGGRHGACESLSNLWATARRHVEAGRTGPARNTLAAFASRAARAYRDGWLTLREQRLLTGNVGYLLSQLR